MSESTAEKQNLPESAAEERRSFDIQLGDIQRLEEVVDRQALRDLCRNFFALFNLSVRVYSSEGSLLADVHEEYEVYRYLAEFQSGRLAVAETVEAIKSNAPAEPTSFEDFAGAVFDVVPLIYQGRQIGRFVVGPYVPAERRSVPREVLRVVPEVDKVKLRDLLSKMPRVKESTAQRIHEHLRGVLDLLLFASHRAHLTSEMHVASVRESYRELAEKTEKLQSAYDRLRELDKLKSNFLATVSHELRTPLTSIIGYSEMLLSGIAGDLVGEQTEFVTTIHTKGEQLLALITSLLDLSKLEQGVLKIHPQELDARAIVDDLAKTMTPHAHRKSIEIVQEIDPDLPRVLGDPVRIKQILFNLAENAIKFTPEGGKVYFGAKAAFLDDDNDGFGAVLMGGARSAVGFTIRDTGIGMPASELPKIFDAFYQVDGSSTREHGGTGLGLSIVKRLVDAHEGTVEVDSAVGDGTTFTVTLPEPR